MSPIQKAILVALGCTAAILLIGVPADTLPVGVVDHSPLTDQAICVVALYTHC